MSDTLLSSILIILSAISLVFQLFADLVFEKIHGKATTGELADAKTSLMRWRKIVAIGAACSISIVSGLLIAEQSVTEQSIQQQLERLEQRVRALENPPPPPPGVSSRTIDELACQIDGILDALELRGHELDEVREHIRRIWIELRQAGQQSVSIPQRGY